jgi:hypothetical protein
MEIAMYECLECGRKFRTAQAAYKASNNGCPKCGGVDIDLAVEASASTYSAEPDYGGAFDGFNVTSDADPGL